MKQEIGKIKIEDYNYHLPQDRIARFPLEERDASKLIIYKDKKIGEDHFKNISSYLPDNTFLIFNNTKVMQARLLFQKETGARIEIFCLEPVSPTSEIQLAFQQKGSVSWKCFIGNARRWKSGLLVSRIKYKNREFKLTAEKVERSENSFLIKFRWEPEGLTFSEILETAGRVPIPPYLNREDVESDKERYQTVYARFDGSVAAPTAGFHFTDKVFEKLKSRIRGFDYLTLHVGAGTFKPVISKNIAGHEMHTERVFISKQTIKNILNNLGGIIPVGTTSVRTIESLYWFGVKLLADKNAEFRIEQWDPYLKEHRVDLPPERALRTIIDYLEENDLEFLNGATQLMIVPGYRFRLIDGMLTNFHQPKSTLLLLIASWLGDTWKDIYNYALDNDFRFLSYGDSCLFL